MSILEGLVIAWVEYSDSHMNATVVPFVKNFITASTKVSNRLFLLTKTRLVNDVLGIASKECVITFGDC